MQGAHSADSDVVHLTELDSGWKVQQTTNYAPFIPTPVNHGWTWDDARIHTLLYRQPSEGVKDVADHLDLTYPTAASLVDDFEELGILHETTGKERNRRHLFREYFELFTR